MAILRSRIPDFLLLSSDKTKKTETTLKKTLDLMSGTLKMGVHHHPPKTHHPPNTDERPLHTSYHHPLDISHQPPYDHGPHNTAQHSPDDQGPLQTDDQGPLQTVDQGPLKTVDQGPLETLSGTIKMGLHRLQPRIVAC